MRWNRKVLLALLLLLHDSRALGQEEPSPQAERGEEETNDDGSIRATLISVQRSLLTSVRLIQDQFDQFTRTHMMQVDSRLAKIENQVDNLAKTLDNVAERATVWDILHHHVQAWSDLTTSMDNKLDLLAMAQNEQLAAMSNHLSSIQPFMTTGIGQISDKIEHLKSDLQRFKEIREQSPLAEFTSRGVLTTLQGIDGKVSALMARSRTRPGSTGSFQTKLPPKQAQTLVSIHESVQSIKDKVFTIEDHVNPTAVSDSCEQVDYKNGDGSPTSHERSIIYRNVQRLSANLLRKSSQRIDDNLDIFSNRMSAMLESSNVDVDRKFNDFFNVTMEMFEHQHHTLENYQKKLSSLEQCCHGTVNDLNSLTADVTPMVKKLDAFITRQNKAVEGNDGWSDRLREQLRFDTERLVVKIESVKKEVQDTCSKSGHHRSHNTVVAGDQPETEQNYSRQPNQNLSSLSLPKSCEEANLQGQKNSGPVELNISHPTWDKRIFCEQETANGGWTVILNRGDYGLPRENFTRTWEDYKRGFGDLDKEFWIGNDIIHELTKDQSKILRIDLEDFEGNRAYAEYSIFRVEDESDQYRIWIAGYNGNASDAMSAHNGYAFSTIDNINDDAPKCCPCASSYGGGWWFYSCFEANLNGVYHENPVNNDYYRGIIWEVWKGDYSLKSARMMIRSRNFMDKVKEETDEQDRNK